jgi:hypothetical protein
MGMRATYSHALPEMREMLVRAHSNAESQTTQRDRLAGFASAHAYAQAIKVLVRSEDYKPINGIAYCESLPPGSLAKCREWLRQDADLILGPEGTETEGKGESAAEGLTGFA